MRMFKSAEVIILAMTPVEIIALLLAALLFVKVFFALVLPDARKNMIAEVYEHPTALVLAALVLGIIIIYYLLQEMTIIQIFATCALFSMLFAVSFAPFGKELIQVVKKTQRTEIVKKLWFALILWIGLAVWVLIELYR